ncbi:peptidyl-prolyl cis-trans isomerase D [Candidatus Kinetoplastibacterium desouzaii TCC079E]|uniref:Periplasmic chaperone PpiD n=1 Tax=Candidatus Kinetoplastidibacterium desouzai TCC079E TaxID=1208919 RepID=M1M3K5_9PROT|nr:peptidylprolyl isomerase [Candidatus Kinetoplastibacterium desouzaii]AGF46825.1 peptidyl-prolyl cis-trans isomerase D [Candidatus Kinetoplastibacterium desouzaii TCC079E]
MFDFFRDKSRWIVIIITILIVPAIFFSGVYNYNQTYNSKKIASLGNKIITLDDFEKAYSRFIERLIIDAGDHIDVSLFDTIDMRKRFLEELINSNLLKLAVNDLDISVSDSSLREYIYSLDLSDGNNFSKDSYLKILHNNGLTPEKFEKTQRESLACRKLMNSITSSPIVSKKILDRYIDYFLQNREIRYIKYKLGDYKSLVSINEEDMLLWYKDNKKLLEIPFNLDIDYLVLDQDSILVNEEITDNDINNFYSKNSLIYGEKRSFDCIFINFDDSDNKNIKDIKRSRAYKIFETLISNPDKFTLFLKEFSDPKIIDKKNDFMWSKEDIENSYGSFFADSVFNLDKNQISDVIESDEGLYIIKVTKISHENIPDKNSIKGNMKEMILNQKKNLYFADLLSKIRSSVYEENKDLAFMAEEFKLKIHSLRGLTQDGKILDNNNKESLNSFIINNNLLKVLFDSKSLIDRKYSNILQISPSIFLIIKIVNVHDTYVPEYNKVRGIVNNYVVQDKSKDLLLKKGNEALDALKNKRDSILLKDFSKPIKISFNESNSDLPKELIDLVMKMQFSDLPSYLGALIDSNFFIVSLDKIERLPNYISLYQDTKNLLLEKAGKSEWLSFIRSLHDQYNLKLFDNVNDIINVTID